jgi:hypothetical protein
VEKINVGKSEPKRSGLALYYLLQKPSPTLFFGVLTRLIPSVFSSLLITPAPSFDESTDNFFPVLAQYPNENVVDPIEQALRKNTEQLHDG